MKITITMRQAEAIFAAIDSLSQSHTTSLSYAEDLKELSAVLGKINRAINKRHKNIVENNIGVKS